MSNPWNVDVSSSGAILLGRDVACDGFVYGPRIRVQTHVHDDHMDGFESSKGLQEIILTKPTLDLLIAKFNADLPYRENVQSIPTGKVVSLDDVKIHLLDSGHMLGAAQVEVTLPDGLRVGYSSDFSWPLDKVIQVAELVIDTTYGSPSSVRRFTQEEANNRFTALVIEGSKKGPVLIRAYRGTLQRALSCLDGLVKFPIIASPSLYKDLMVYQQHGYALTNIHKSDTPEGKRALKEKRYIRAYGPGDRWPTDPSDATCIVLSAYMSNMENPAVEYSDRSYAVAFSDHADFNGTLEYVRATGAKRVLTDNSRGGHAVDLAFALRELGIEAIPSHFHASKEWGK